MGVPNREAKKLKLEDIDFISQRKQYVNVKYVNVSNMLYCIPLTYH